MTNQAQDRFSYGLWWGCILGYLFVFILLLARSLLNV